MSVNIYAGNFYGVDLVVLALNDGTAQPQVSSAVSLDADTVRITFDRSMEFARDAVGDPLAGVLNPASYQITEQGSGLTLGVMAVAQFSPTQVDLTTSQQRSTPYDVEVWGPEDLWDNPIDPLNNTAVFTGILPIYPTPAGSFYSFFGMYSGVQETGQSSVDPDVTPPVLQNQVPNPSDINIAVDTNITLEVVDVDSGVNAGSVVLRVNGIFAWHTDTQQTGYTVVKTPIPNGYSYEINPDTDFTSYEDVVVRVVANDLAPLPNVLDESYSFRIVDTEVPYLANQNPAPTQVGVSPLASVYLDILDVGDPINASTVTITIGGTVAWQAGALQNSYTGSETPLINGYRYALTPPAPLPQLALVLVRVEASDTAPVPNALDTTYSFTTATDVPPQVLNIDPESGESEVAEDKVISFDAYDNVGINEASTLIVVNSVLAYSGSASKNGFVVTKNTITQGFHYTVTPPTDWPFGGVITVQIHLRDDLGVTTDFVWTFFIYEDPNCFTGPINAFEASLLVPYDLAGTTLYHTEILRSKLLLAVSSRPDPIKAVRQIFLRAHRHDLSSVLRQVVTAPSVKERASKLCYKRTIIQIDADLRGKPGLLKAALAELSDLGLPVPHRQMLRRYLSTDEPNDLVPLACFIIVLAKALEANALS